MKNSNNFNNKSEIIAKLILNKIFSYVETEIKKRDIEEKIPLFCGEYLIDYYINPLVSLNKFLLIKKEESNKNNNDLLFTNLKQENTWVEIKEPSTPIKERAMTSNLKVIYNLNDYNIILNGLIDNLGIHRIGLDRIDINQFSESYFLKRSNSQILSKKVMLKTKSLFEMNKLRKKKKKKEAKNQIFSNFKVYDIPNFKNIPYEEPKDYQKLRENFEKEKLKKLEQLRKEKEKEKRKKLNIFNFANKKDFDSKKYTFDSNGQVIQYHPYKLEMNSNELLESKSIVGKTKIENNLNQLPIIENNIKINHNKNKKIRVDKNKKYYLKYNEENKRKKIPIPPAGSNFNIIKPEIGVIIHENDKTKGGNMNFVSKYNKTSIEEYSKIIREKNFSNSIIPINKNLNKTKDKKDTINTSKKKEQINKSDFKKENDNFLDSHISISPNIHYMNDNMAFAINFQGTNKNFHSVNVSQNDININQSLFSNRNNPLLNHSISTIYNENTNVNNDYKQGKIFVKDSFLEFKKSLMESDSELKNSNNNISNNCDNTQLNKNYSCIYMNKKKNSILNLKSINKNLFKISPSAPSLLKLNKKFVGTKKKYNKFV